MKDKKFQYAGVITLLLLAVMLYVSLSMAISTLEERNEHFSKKYKQETFHFVTGENVSESQLKTWEENYTVTLEKRSYQDVRINGDKTLRLFEPTDQVNLPYISSGTMPNQLGEIALSKVFAQKNGYEIGDRIKLNGVNAEVSGFVYLPDYIYMVERQTDILSDAEKFGIGVSTKETLGEMEGSQQSQVLGISSDGKVPEGLRKGINKQTSLLKFISREENARIQFVESEIEGAKTMITTLPLFILALSVVMVLMLLKRRMDMQRKEIGTLMALGYRKGELMRHYLGYAWVTGLTGTILGILAGGGLSIPLSNLYANYFNLPQISMFDFDPWVLVIGFLIPITLILTLTALVITRSLSTDPLTLLRPKEIATGKKSWIERIPWFIKGGFFRRFKLRLMARSKARSLYIFLGVMFSTVLLLFGLITFNSMDRLVETTYKEIQTYEYAVHFNALQTDQPSEEGSPFTMNEVTVVKEDKEEKINLYGIVPETEQLQLSNHEGMLLNGQLTDGAIISQPLAAVFNVESGDRLVLTNALNEKEMETEIAGIADVFIGSSMYLPKERVNEFLGFPQGSYTAVWQDKAPKESENVFMIEDKQKVIESFESTSGATRYSVIAMSVIAILIGVIVLTLLTNLIVEENSPSISLFKVMGYQDKEVSRLILSIYTPVVLISYFLSIPLGGLALEQTMNSLVEETGFLLPTDITWWMVVIGFGVIILTYWISLYFSKRKLKQVSLQEALKKQQD
ncbi:ABC transporter permease [Halobacillus mangrovi]|uniref:ABC transporter permease n=1 Tax=Halobacillus mangrovi TaxID=402384 RepID=UPI003D9678B3